MEKSASASPEQNAVLQAAWPADNEPLTKVARLARVIAAGKLVEEAELSLAGNNG